MEAPPSRPLPAVSRALQLLAIWPWLAVLGCYWRVAQEVMPPHWAASQHRLLQLRLAQRQHRRRRQLPLRASHQALHQGQLQLRDQSRHQDHALLRRAKAQDSQQFITTASTKIRIRLALSQTSAAHVCWQDVQGCSHGAVPPCG